MKKIVSLSLMVLVYLSMVVMPVTAIDQPAMKNAKDHLNKAKSALNRATPDKGGHRNKAKELVNRALSQVNAGIAYDRNHPRDRRKNSTEESEPIETYSFDQPAMEEAKEQLEKALDSLKNATPDKGGHRNNAIDLTKDAIEQVKKGMAFDARN